MQTGKQADSSHLLKLILDGSSLLTHLTGHRAYDEELTL